MSENHFDPVLDELTERSVGRLLMSDTFDAPAFEQLEMHLWQKAEGLKHESAISKQVLLTLRTAISAIETRADHLPSVQEHRHWANDLSNLLDRIIAGETRADRAPEVPRIL